MEWKIKYVIRFWSHESDPNLMRISTVTDTIPFFQLRVEVSRLACLHTLVDWSIVRCWVRFKCSCSSVRTSTVLYNTVQYVRVQYLNPNITIRTLSAGLAIIYCSTERHCGFYSTNFHMPLLMASSHAYWTIHLLYSNKSEFSISSCDDTNRVSYCGFHSTQASLD